MYKFSGWMMRTGKTFDAATVQAWIGAQVQTRKYFLGLPAGTTGQVLGTVEMAAQQYLVLVEWERTEQAVRRLDCFGQEAAESYLLRVEAAADSSVQET
jgi:hypothetical protein